MQLKNKLDHIMHEIIEVSFSINYADSSRRLHVN